MPAAPLIVTTPVLAALCGVTERRIQQLAKEGVFGSETHGKWNATVCVPAYIAHRVAQEHTNTAARTGGAGEKLQGAKARQVELRTAREEHVLIETAEALAVVDEIIGTAKAAFSAVPARITRDITIRDRIEEEHAAAFDRLAAQFARRAAELRRAGEAGVPSEPEEIAAPAEPKPARKPASRKPE